MQPACLQDYPPAITRATAGEKFDMGATRKGMCRNGRNVRQPDCASRAHVIDQPLRSATPDALYIIVHQALRRDHTRDTPCYLQLLVLVCCPGSRAIAVTVCCMLATAADIPL